MNESLVGSVTVAAATAAAPTFDPLADAILGAITLTCFLIGVPGNLLATIYFIQEHMNNSRNIKKLYFTELYISMTSVDLLLSATLFPIFENFFNSRKGFFFKQESFCLVWGLVWEIVPCLSVFLVGLLSISRMLILVKPMQALSVKVLRCIIGSYVLYHLGIRSLFWLLDENIHDIKKIAYTATTSYCYFSPKETPLWIVNAYHAGIVLGFPILPISLSFFLSLYKLSVTGHGGTSTNSQSFSRVAQTQATVTIIIVTCVYLICNLPVFINYAFYTDVIIHDDKDFTRYLEVYTYGGVFMGNYVWPLSYVVLVALNATINPIVFLLRMRPFKEFVLALLPFARFCRGKGMMQTQHKRGGPAKDIVTTSSF